MKELFMNLPSISAIVLDPISLVIIGMYIALMIWEAIAPARQLPKVKYWKAKGLISFAVFFLLSSYLPLIWDNYLIEYQIFDLTGLGVFGGAILGFVIYEFALYVWHRAMHASDFLWKVFHQMHHSIERMDSYSAFYFSPMDMIGFTFLGSFCFTIIAGFDPKAVVIIILITNFFAIVQHCNIRTPHWIGYLVQRPEGHTYHHKKGVHAYNYSDLSFIDMLFGTFSNPKTHPRESGFYSGGSEKIIDMILFRDINKKNS
ncbi:sterol desaturase family protein [uncultured Aquimarina sp.]|uniref:sterol desaturase family protein n=1 Tax=uncultured Aquimarina sp. TaxID=575652 RepID=UPI0026321A95|nr:sterol desaturase family protein [uncultured Aquimarina sp.]